MWDGETPPKNLPRMPGEPADSIPTPGAGMLRKHIILKDLHIFKSF